MATVPWDSNEQSWKELHRKDFYPFFCSPASLPTLLKILFIWCLLFMIILILAMSGMTDNMTEKKTKPGEE